MPSAHLPLQIFLPVPSDCLLLASNASSVAFNASWERPGSLPLISIPVSVSVQPWISFPQPFLISLPTHKLKNTPSKAVIASVCFRG